MEVRNVKSTPIAIVGGGPVGLMLAMFLDQQGVDCVVFNAETSSRPHPKGSTHNSRTMEHYRRLGFAHRIRGLGLPEDHPTDVAYFTRFDRPEMARLRMSSEAAARAMVAASSSLDQVPEPIHRANQMYVEKVLFEEAASRPHITLKFGTRVTGISQDGDGVRIETSDETSGHKAHWKCLYAVGCDGGRSFVRGQLGIAYEGYENLKQAFFGGRMISTYLRAPTLYRDLFHDKRAWQYWIVNAQLRTALVALDGKDEFLLWSKDPRPDEPIDDSVVIATVREAAGSDVPVEILGHGKWTAGVALVAERFAVDRIFLAGDAVHLFTPTGGFGMNTGVDDAANLSWKLAALVQGWGGPRLLASYESERKAVARRNTAAARALAVNVGAIPVSIELDSDTASGKRARAETAAFLSTFGDEYASIGVQLGARYDGSPVILSAGAPPLDDLSSYRPSSVPGGRAPHFWLGGGRRSGDSIFDKLGTGFTLLCFEDEACDESIERAARDFNRAATLREMPLTVLRVRHDEARNLYGARLALIRPDQHVAWRGESGPADVEMVLNAVTGSAAL